MIGPVYENELYDIYRVNKVDVDEIIDFVEYAADLAKREWGGDIEEWIDDFGYYVADKEWEAVYAVDRRTGHVVGIKIYKIIPKTKALAVGYVIVEDDYRGRGVGTTMFEYTEKFAREKGVKIIFSDMSEPMSNALEHYAKKNGYAFAKIPFMLPDEPLATYLGIKPISITLDEITPEYIQNLYEEYLENSYSKWELMYNSESIGLEKEVLEYFKMSNKRIEFTQERFLKDIDDKYKQTETGEFEADDIKKFVKEVFEINYL